MKNLSLIILGFIIPIFAISQTTVPNNTPFSGAYLGWSGAQNLDFKTNSIPRMQLMQTSTYTVDSYTFDNSGFLGLSTDPHFFGPFEPYSLIHLNGDNQGSGPQQWGYRPWMTPGITFTHNRDFMYIGPYAHGLDHTDAVIAWADNKNQDSNGPDVLRFIFTNRASGNTSTSSDVFSDDDIDGVEVGRITGKGLTGLGSYWIAAGSQLKAFLFTEFTEIPFTIF